MEDGEGGGGEARREVGVGMCSSSRKKGLKKNNNFEAARSPQDTWGAGGVRNENGGEEMRADEE